MPSQLHMLFGFGPPLSFAARARNGRALVRAAPSQNPNSVYAGSVVRGGDYVSVSRASFPGGYPVAMSSDGLLVVRAGGATTRQLVLAELYSRRLQLWTGDSNQYINNHRPVGNLLSLELVVGVAPDPLLLASLFADADGDLVVPTAVSGDLWPGAVQVAYQISGAPTDVGSGFFQVSAVDPPGDIGVAQVNWTVFAAPPPPPAAGGHVDRIRVKSHIGGALTGN